MVNLVIKKLRKEIYKKCEGILCFESKKMSIKQNKKERENKREARKNKTD